jgi:radical SAM protein with 4Fe4S-binding SPASM domain
LLFTLRPENISELSPTVELAEATGVEQLTVNVFKKRDNSDWTIPYRSEILNAFNDAEECAARTGIKLILPDHLGDYPVVSRAAHKCTVASCLFPWTQVAVRWNGEITPCNMMNPYRYGNLDRMPFEAVWNGPEARTFRQLANGNERHPYCRSCYYVDSESKVIT